MARKITIEAPSRLHLGLVNPFNKDYRLYIAVGVAIDRPQTVISVYVDDPISIEGCRSSEVYTRIKPIVEEYGLKRGRVVIEKCVPVHVGLGSTTQLLLSVAHGLMLSNGLNPDVAEIEEMAKKIGLGRISGVGTYIYMYGGLVVDSGKRHEADFPQLLMRFEVPESWRFVVAIPAGTGLDEIREREVFEAREEVPGEVIWYASYTLFAELLPSLLEGEFELFAKALTKFQETVGKMFSKYQGGVFAQHSAAVINKMKELGLVGVGQSSWGPTVYGITDTHEKAVEVSSKLKEVFDGLHVFVARPRNKGAVVRFVVE
ncbi:MAG: GHMP kinase [Desulfurococcaceae archaeon]